MVGYMLRWKLLYVLVAQLIIYREQSEKGNYTTIKLRTMIVVGHMFEMFEEDKLK